MGKTTLLKSIKKPTYRWTLSEVPGKKGASAEREFRVLLRGGERVETRSLLPGLKKGSVRDLIGAIKAGLPAKAVERFRKKTGLTRDQLAAVTNIPSRTLARRLHEGRFRADESERIARVVQVYDKAVEVLGSGLTARQWMATPKRALAGQTPLEFMDTAPGATEVMDLLGRIEHGVIS